ncbi:GDP-mannose 4,6-dehydratase [Candidatus Cryosericum odellii]|jgi:dTDP-D-glucose 4,6-dehydratase|nr:GDP-mannose 4,6-dehydratase [Candidatus Cryosericum odellii]
MTETMLVTGGCGFIGSCFIFQQMQQYPEIHLLNLDALTYAGNPDNVKEVAGDPRYTFVQADVADRPGHDRRYALDAAKAHRMFDWLTQASFERQVQRCLAWG